MKESFGALVVAAGICGILSFALLATSLGTDYWYIIEMNSMHVNDFEDLSSHSGLWSINEGKQPLLKIYLAEKDHLECFKFCQSMDSCDQFWPNFPPFSPI